MYTDTYKTKARSCNTGRQYIETSSSLQGEMMICERLKTARLRAGLSQEKLGKLAGIDPTSASARMNQYERGKHAPDYRLMCKVAEILQTPVSWFYTEDEDLARLQEVYHQLDTDNRRDLVARAEALLGSDATVTHA
jgi:transcriptional regulator with XRE-family HTH domain